MNAETIKDFLVSLGFNLDESGYQKFNSVLTGATANAIKMGLAVEGAALSVVAFTAKIASGLDQLYWASQRTGATVQGIKAVGYAVSQVGGSADAARSSLENLSRFMRNNPGAEGFLNRLGVQTRDASGKMRDMSSIFTGVGQKLSSMPYYRANQYAQMLGIDENTLMAMRRGVGQFSAQYSAMAKAIGFNANEAAVSSNRFMTSLRAFSEAAGMARDKIGATLAGGLVGSMDNLRKQLLDNWPRIEAVLTKVIKGILWAGDAITRVLWRAGGAVSDIIDWFKRLDPATQQLITLFGALLVAWRLLNSAFLASPIGIVMMLAGALVLLYDDYKTWKEGGDSLIDWEKWAPGVNEALKNIKELQDSISGLTDSLLKLLGMDPKSWSLKWDFQNFISQMGEFGKMLNLIADLLNAINEGRWSDAASIGKQLLYQGSGNPSAMPDVTDSANSAADWVKNKTGWDPRSVGQTVRGWFGLGGDESEQFGQSVKRPQPTKAGAELLGWMQPMLGRLEQLYQLPEGLLRSVAITESAGNQFAMSGAGAKGLFQFMDGTARDMGLRGNDVFNPEKSAQAAAKYLSQLLRQNGGDLSKALASYNWGIGNVQRYGMGLMPQETRNYIPKVMSNMPTSAPVIQQETNINIHGVSDPREAARLTVDRQKGVNSQLTQQLPAGPR